ncbi:MAG: hypothetical protein M1822_001568 [Bathelium mastoideum]|nr:MAG: hypothetical protein M1822_001568 [Bathelium mastoideum]
MFSEAIRTRTGWLFAYALSVTLSLVAITPTGMALLTSLWHRSSNYLSKSPCAATWTCIIYIEAEVREAAGNGNEEHWNDEEEEATTRLSSRRRITAAAAHRKSCTKEHCTGG